MGSCGFRLCWGDGAALLHPDPARMKKLNRAMMQQQTNPARPREEEKPWHSKRMRGKMHVLWGPVCGGKVEFFKRAGKGESRGAVVDGSRGPQTHNNPLRQERTQPRQRMIPAMDTSNKCHQMKMMPATDASYGQYEDKCDIQ
mmetsp:Transcript_19095/g.32808  ORF Transcript_19095/g.32808 Transcript_19095/m.32808 type:complete len:143 (-) Transcript_19095:800-1228(-)